MHTLLKSPCDLMWFGGIGTYVKAASETHADAGDKANDLIRVDGQELRCRVIGEGANLGLTQRGRIAAAQSGVRLNTDAIDNSAGVDSSDHEVNIKILLNGLVRSGQMTKEGRDVLLAQMTEDVGAHVLRHNYAQTLAISLQEGSAVANLDAHERFIETLEKAGRLDRKVEYLPSAETFRTRRGQSQGLTRPELSVLTAYSKLTLFDQLIASDAPDDPLFEDVLIQYFPKGCHEFSDAMGKHRLRREIIATVLSNKMVDLGGAIFMDRVRESAMVETGAIARAFAAARAIFGLDEAIAEVNALDLKISAQAQSALMSDIIALLTRQCFWLAKRSTRGDGANKSVRDLVKDYGDGLKTLAAIIYDIVTPSQKLALESKMTELRTAGTPSALAKFVVALAPLTSATDIVDIATESDLPIEAVARLYHALGASSGLDDVRTAAAATITPDHWDRVATGRLVEEFMSEQGTLTAIACDHAKAKGLIGSDSKWAKSVLDSWSALNKGELERTRTAIAELKASPGGWSFAKLAIANTQLKELAQSARA
jgi:glutamate dehydrogenase